MPAALAARATPTSPWGWKIRLYPTGARSSGIDSCEPSTSVVVSQLGICTALRGRNRTSFQLRRFSCMVTSPSAPPSM